MGNKRGVVMHKKLISALLVTALLSGCQAPVDMPEQNVVEASGMADTTETGQVEEMSETETEVDDQSSNMVSDKAFLLETDMNGVTQADLDHYTITAVLDAEAKRLACEQTLVYKNKEDQALEEVVIQVLPNAYRTVESAPVLFGDIDSIYPNGFAPGFIDFTSVKLEGQGVDYTLYGDDETLMKITFDQPLEVGDTIKLDMVYDVQIPPAYDRFGYNDSTFNIANWYPVAAVYDESGWNEDGYLAVGDPFYTDMGVYSITYDVPESYEIASTGVRTSEVIENGRKRVHYSAEFVRDSAWLTSDQWQVHVEEVEGTMIRSYYFGEFSFPEQKAVDAARDSIKSFNRIFGPYPYSELSVVATDFPSGMEYPTLVMIAKDRYKSARMNALESVIAHEIGHQWWYGVVGNDQIDEAWLDESLTVFSTAMYYGEVYGDDAYRSYVESYRNSYQRRKVDDGNGVVVKPLTEFASWSDYSNLVYRKGMLFIDALRDEYGKESVLEFMQKYYARYKFKTASTEKFLDLGKEHFGESFDALVDVWLYNTGNVSN